MITDRLYGYLGYPPISSGVVDCDWQRYLRNQSTLKTSPTVDVNQFTDDELRQRIEELKSPGGNLHEANWHKLALGIRTLIKKIDANEAKPEDYRELAGVAQSCDGMHSVFSGQLMNSMHEPNSVSSKKCLMDYARENLQYTHVEFPPRRIRFAR